jgi:hypothetical protein
VAAGANPVQITRGIEKTAKALVEELRKLSKEVKPINLLFGLHKYLICASVELYYSFLHNVLSVTHLLFTWAFPASG